MVSYLCTFPFLEALQAFNYRYDADVTVHAIDVIGTMKVVLFYVLLLSSCEHELRSSRLG